MEFGGYVEFPTFTGTLYHDKALKLNNSRNCLAYLIESLKFKKILIPYFLCGSVESVCKRYDIEVSFYHVDNNLLPLNITLSKNQWLYIVNYYGLLNNDLIHELKEKFQNIIVDNVQSFYQRPVEGVHTIYSARKYFGVPDGAFLYTDSLLNREIVQDYSYDRMLYVLGRFEKGAQEFYSAYKMNNELMENLPLMSMSKLTENILRSYDYQRTEEIRKINFSVLHESFSKINKLNLMESCGTFMYPLYIDNGSQIRTELHKKNIYVPTLWPDVCNKVKNSDLEFDLVNNILPLPIDQRYSSNDMMLMIKEVMKCINSGN